MNELIEKKRRVALDILKPSQKDLEHGLKLHQESVVIEPYCLGLRTAVDAGVLKRLHEEGASDREFIDHYSDMATLGWALSEEARIEYREAWEASGVTCIFQNAGEEGNHPMRLLYRLARHTCLTDLMPDYLKRARTAGDIEQAHADGKKCICMALNGVPLVGEQLTVEDELHYIHVFAQLGARMMHLTYNRRNPMGDGCGEPDNAGLSDFGHAVVREMNRNGVIIDLAHTGWKTCLDTAKATSQPVVVSHSAVWELNHHIRCKPDDVIRAVLDTGGVMGITNVPTFLGGSANISAFLDHIDYLAKHFGCDGISIATDRSYSSERCATTDQEIPARQKRRQRWESLWPKEHAEMAKKFNKPENLESMDWTNWPLFTVGLVQRGYSDDDIRKIIGGNMLRVMRDVPPNAAYWNG